MTDPFIELLEDAFGAGFDHANNGVWGWTQAFQNFLNDFNEEIAVVRIKGEK